MASAFDHISRLLSVDPILHSGLYDSPGETWIEQWSGPKHFINLHDRVVVPYLDIPDDAERDLRIARLLFRVARRHRTLRVTPTRLVQVARKAFGRKLPLAGLLMSRSTLLKYFRDRVRSLRRYPWQIDRNWGNTLKAMSELIKVYHPDIPHGWVVATTLPEEVGCFTCDGDWACPWGVCVRKDGVRVFRLK